ncbi:MAG: hypothetical protein ABJM47_09790 [Lentilitoribacter sp.]
MLRLQQTNAICPKSEKKTSKMYQIFPVATREIFPISTFPMLFFVFDLLCLEVRNAVIVGSIQKQNINIDQHRPGIEVFVDEQLKLNLTVERQGDFRYRQYRLRAMLKPETKKRYKYAAACELSSNKQLLTCIHSLNMACAVPVVGAGYNPAWFVVPP